MLFMTYRPRALKSVKAEQITAKNIEEIAASLFGVAVVAKEEDLSILKIATMNGVITAVESEWIVRSEDGIAKMTDEEFNEKYEKARSTGTRES